MTKIKVTNRKLKETATCYNDIDPVFLKITAENIGSYLLSIFLEVFPDSLKIAIVILLYNAVHLFRKQWLVNWTKFLSGLRHVR